MRYACRKYCRSSTSANNARERGNAQRSPAPSKPGPGPSSSQGFAAAGMGSGNRTVPFMNLANDPLYQQALETARQSAVLAAAGATRHSAAKGAGAVVLASSAAAASTLTAAAPLAQTPTPLPPPPARSSRQQDAHHAPSNRSGAGSRGGLQADSASRRNDARGSTTPQPQWQQRSAEGPSSRQQTPEGSSQGNLNRALFNVSLHTCSHRRSSHACICLAYIAFYLPWP